MKDYRLADLLDLTIVQKMADAHYRAAGMPIGIIDAIDGSVLVGAGWQDICFKFHRTNPDTAKRCQESDSTIKEGLTEGEACQYKCKNGLWDIGIPIVVAGRHLATMFLGQFFYEDEAPDREYFTQQARQFNFDVAAYLSALDRVPVFNREKVDYILEYNKTLVTFIADLADSAISKIEAEKIIRNSERRFQAVFDQAYQFVGLLTLDGRVVKANRTALNFSGIEEADVLGRPFWDTPWWAHTPDQKQIVRQAVRQAAAGDQVEFEAIHRDSDGNERYFDFSLKPVMDDDGRVVHLIPEGRDITARKLAEKEIQRQSEFRQHLIDAIPFPVFFTDRRERYISCNSAFERFCGLSRKEIAGKKAAEIAPRDLAVALHQADAQLLAHPGTATYEESVRSAEGIRQDVIFHKATFDWPEASPSGIVGLIVDITERKRVEKALEQSEAKLRSILDNIGIGVALISPDMQVIEMNRRMRKWFPRVDPSQCPICYRAFSDPPREDICDYCPSCKTLQDGQVHEATTTTTPQTGKSRHYRIVSSPLRNTAGEIMGVVEIVDDITAHMTLESQFRQAQKMEAVGRLAGGVAHDFNNMLGVIHGYAELAMYKVDPDKPLHADLEQILKAAQRSTEIVRQLLAFARKQTIAPRIIDLNETVEGILKMLRRLIGEDIDLVWHPDSGLWPVKMDPTQIEQILANLCVNARDAIANIGKVTIETQNAVLDQAYCDNHPGFRPGQYAMLTVSDDGSGIDAVNMDKIFEPFFTTKQVGKGTGLGLATVYGIVKQNNGFINVYSEKDKGTTFRIYLPRNVGSEGPATEDKRLESIPGQGQTILVVEDDTSVLELTCRMLDGLGYKSLAAQAPEDALALVQSHTGQIDLLMTDVILPNMNGRDLAAKIKNLRPTIKCLYMSGYTADVIAHRGILDLGVQFISKPFSEHDLSVMVSKTLYD